MALYKGIFFYFCFFLRGRVKIRTEEGSGRRRERSSRIRERSMQRKRKVNLAAVLWRKISSLKISMHGRKRKQWWFQGSYCSQSSMRYVNLLNWLRQLYLFHPSVLLLTIKISRAARENSLSYCKKPFVWFDFRAQKNVLWFFFLPIHGRIVQVPNMVPTKHSRENCHIINYSVHDMASAIKLLLFWRKAFNL